MSFTRIAICSLTLVAAGVGCQRDRNDSQGEPYSRAVERGASDFDRSMAPTGTTAASNTRGGTSMTTDTPMGESPSAATGAGTTGTGSIPPASTAGTQNADKADGSAGRTTDQNREARRGTTKRSATQRSDAGTQRTDAGTSSVNSQGTRSDTTTGGTTPNTPATSPSSPSTPGSNPNAPGTSPNAHGTSTHSSTNHDTDTPR